MERGNLRKSVNGPSSLQASKQASCVGVFGPQNRACCSVQNDYLPFFLRAYLPNKVLITGYQFFPWVQFWNEVKITETSFISQSANSDSGNFYFHSSELKR